MKPLDSMLTCPIQYLVTHATSKAGPDCWDTRVEQFRRVGLKLNNFDSTSIRAEQHPADLVKRWYKHKITGHVQPWWHIYHRQLQPSRAGLVKDTFNQDIDKNILSGAGLGRDTFDLI